MHPNLWGQHSCLQSASSRFHPRAVARTPGMAPLDTTPIKPCMVPTYGAFNRSGRAADHMAP
eukprot:6554667-Lingulodinium_polyedra.AAC.1